MMKIKVSHRFTTQVTLSRIKSDGVYENGKWVEGMEQRWVICVSWQPIPPSEYRLLPEGESPLGVYVAYWNGVFFYGEDDKRRSDYILHQSKTYKLIQLSNWSGNGFTSAFFSELK